MTDALDSIIDVIIENAEIEGYRGNCDVYISMSEKARTNVKEKIKQILMEGK